MPIDDKNLNYDLALTYAEFNLKRCVDNGYISNKAKQLNVPEHVLELDCLLDGFNLSYEYFDNREQ